MVFVVVQFAIIDSTSTLIPVCGVSVSALVVLAGASSSSSLSLQSPEEDGGGTATPSVASVVISV